MTPSRCHEHPSAPATHRCDACARLLCDDCVELGTALLFCRHCGERAVRLDGGHWDPGDREARRLAQETDAATAPAVAETPTRPFDAATVAWAARRLRDALGVVGRDTWLLAAALLAVAFSLADMVPELGCLLVVPQLMALMLVPHFLATLLRNPGENARRALRERVAWTDFARCTVAMLAALLPLMLLLALSSCDLVSLAGGTTPASLSIDEHCIVPLLGGLLAFSAIWPLAVGAAVYMQSAWYAPRLDLHWDAMRKLRTDLLPPALGLAATLVLPTVIALPVFFLTPVAILVRNLASVVLLFATTLLVARMWEWRLEELQWVYLTPDEG